MIRRLLLHCLDATYPPVDGMPGIRDTDPGPFVDRMLREAPLLMRLGIVAGIAVFVLSPPITVWRPAPSFLLSAETLDRHAAIVADHPLYLVRSAVFVLKMVAGLHYGAVPEVRARWGLPAYPPDPDAWRTT